MWTVYFKSDPGFPFDDKTTCGGFRWGIWYLEANHRAPFTHVFLPAILKKTGTLREVLGPSSTGVRREAPCLVTHARGSGSSVCLLRAQRKSSFPCSTFPHVGDGGRSLPPAVRYRGPLAIVSLVRISALWRY